MNNKSFFKLFANCVPVKGFKRSTICDLHTQLLFYIPNDMYELIMFSQKNNFEKVIEKYGSELEEKINGYYNYLISNDLGFWTNNPELFPELSLDWDAPSQITNAIIDSSKVSNHHWENIINQLEELGCMDLQLRFFDIIQNTEIESILKILDGRRIKSVELILCFNEKLSKNFLKLLTKKNPRIKTIFVHSSPENYIFKITSKDGEGMGNVLFTKQVIENQSHCGLISPLYFTFNTKAFAESQKYNSCLNRKIGIDIYGKIKNCPSLNKDFGIVSEVQIKDVIANEDFLIMANISKDQIQICKDCEHRYVCTDCRAYIEDEDNIKSKPKKCSYNPYEASWS